MKDKNKKEFLILFCNAIGVGTSTAVVVLNILGELKTENAITLLGIGLFAVSMSLLLRQKKVKL